MYFVGLTPKLFLLLKSISKPDPRMGPLKGSAVSETLKTVEQMMIEDEMFQRDIKKLKGMIIEKGRFDPKFLTIARKVIEKAGNLKPVLPET